MRAFFRTSALVAVFAASVTLSTRICLSQEPKKEATGSVSGRVTVGDKPVPRAIVLLTSSDPFRPDRTLPARATTDAEGRYHLTGVPAGSYTLGPFTPALVVATETFFGQPGKSVTLGDGEEVTGLDFSLTRGAVIAGRVTGSDGRPVIDQDVTVVRIDERGQRMGSGFNPSMFTTDDRGAYRVYGLSPGRYKVSVGDANEAGMVRIGGSVYARTFHPDVTDESRAAVIEVTAGGEAIDVDIKLGGAAKTYVATGRIVDADTGKPLADLRYGHGAIVGQQERLGGYGWTNNRSNSRGEFRIEGLNSGRFAAFVVSTEQVDFYSEPAVFEVNESDVSGLEIKVRRGSSISGIAVVEGPNDADANPPKLDLRAFVRTEGLSAPATSSIPINPDGSFLITGIRPGKVRIFLGGAPKGFTLLRVEREGALQSDGVEVGSGESVSGVRVVIGHGTGVVRGEVRVQGGQLTPDMRLSVRARRLEGEDQVAVGAFLDARGRFTLEGLLPGEYEVVVYLMNPVTQSGSVPPPRGVFRSRTLAKQNIVVSNGAETQMTLVADLSAKDKDSEK
jgi:Carboxypeptidase regulatory-like domain